MAFSSMKMMRQFAKSLLASSCRPRLSAGRLSGATSEAMRVLVFHDIPFAERDKFSTLIAFLARRYQFVKPERLEEVISGSANARRAELLLTFDDGFRSNLWAAREVLRPLGISALFFVPSQFPDLVDRDDERQFVADRIFDRGMRKEDVSDGMAPMTWTELASLLDEGHTIGAHTITHTRLSTLVDPRVLQQEIVGSGEKLEIRLGVRIDHFAYPFGDIGSISQEGIVAARNRFRFVHSCVRGPNRKGTPAAAVRRDGFAATDSPHYVESVLEGGLDWYYRARARRLDSLARA